MATATDFDGDEEWALGSRESLILCGSMSFLVVFENPLWNVRVGNFILKDCHIIYWFFYIVVYGFHVVSAIKQLLSLLGINMILIIFGA